MLSPNYILALLSRFSRCFLLHIFGAMSFIAPSFAQNTETGSNPEDNLDYLKVRLGFYVSGSGLVANVFPGPLPFYSGGNIEKPEDDGMPYPAIFLSIRYDKYALIIGSSDNSSDNREYLNNENIRIFAARYNYYPFTKNVYLFGGPILWRFNKKYSFTKYVCEEYAPNDNFMYNEQCTKGSVVVIETDRPNGKSLTFGIHAGVGIEYKLFNLFVLSHELEFFYSPCKYKQFICAGSDLKFLGVHLDF